MSAPEKRRAYLRAWREAHPDYFRAYYERARRGEIQLPPLDWAICARGGSPAQARKHRLRGQKPCPTCLRAESARSAQRRARMRAQAAS